MKKISVIGCLGYVMLFMAAQTVVAEDKVKAPPLPLQNVEGFGGILITGSAYLINPSEEGKVFGLPGGGCDIRKHRTWKTLGSIYRI